jgi:pSer/pThr/pTyr-binding forkhead associated (FHA) protein
MTEQKPTKNQQDSWHLVATTGWLAGQSFAINKHAVLGRDADCDITIPGTHLSRRHAEIAVNGDKLLVRDLGSANGTFVNEQAITDAEMQTGDTIRFDVLSFTVRGPNQLLTAEQPSAEVSSKPSNQATTRKPKPTSVGNRDKTVHMTAIQKTSSALTVVVGIILGLGCIAALGYLVMQL